MFGTRHSRSSFQFAMSAAPANPFDSKTAQLQAEHISLQSETVEAKAKMVPRKVLVKYQLRSRARGSTTRIHILDDQFVAVQVKRPRLPDQEYTVDLRFVDPKPIGIRKVVWPWMYVALAFTLLAAGMGFFTFKLANPAQLLWAVPAAIVLGTLTVSSFLMCLYYTTESVVFVSTHGRARLIVITGGLGTTRAAKQCAQDVVKQINLARKKSKQKRQSFLRDEMREHTRLHQVGALNDAQFDEAQKRILQSHE
jgi:hypothetical protein